MILHTCIKCDEPELIPLAEGKLPVFQKYTCPKCGTTQWIKHSRIDPKTYPEDMIEVDEKKHSVVVKTKGERPSNKLNS